MLNAQGLVQQKLPDRAGLLATLEAQERTLRRLVLLRPADGSAQGQLATILLRIGIARVIAGAGEPALATFHEATAIRRKLASGPSSEGLRPLAAALDTEAKIAFILKRVDLASAAAREMVAVSRLLTADGRPDSQITLASALMLLARSSADPGPLLQEAATIFNGLPEEQMTGAARSLRTSIRDQITALSRAAAQPR